jgi:hypothetical protein
VPAPKNNDRPKVGGGGVITKTELGRFGLRAYCVWAEQHLSSTCCVTLDGSDSSISDDDDFAHDGDDGAHFGFTVLDEAFEEGAHGWGVVSCGHGGHEEGAFEACAPAPDGSSASRDSAVARVRGAAGEAGGGAPIDAAEFGHARLEDEGGLSSNAGDRGERVEASLEARIGGDDRSGASLGAAISLFKVASTAATERASVGSA